MGLEKQGSKPTGFIGKLIGRLMNRFHTDLYIKYFKAKLPKNNSIILDIGCGGGQFVKYLSEENDSYTIYGIDHSQEMIKLSHNVNQSSIEKGNVAFFKSSVTEISLETNTIDLITAFETIQFWPDIEKSLKEVNRLLKTGGEFIIINRYPPEGSKWWEMATFKSDKAYEDVLTKSGFHDIKIDLVYKKGWIIVNSKK